MGSKLLFAIRDLINIMLKGFMPPEITPIFYGANLCALKKKIVE